MKKKILILFLALYSTFPAGIFYGAVPQASQFLYLGDFPLSLENTFFSPFLNPASRQEGENIRLDSFYGTLSKETLMGAGMGFPAASGTYGFQFIYLNTESALTSSFGIQTYYSRQLARDFFFGLAINAFRFQTSESSAWGAGFSTGVVSFFKIQDIPVKWGAALVNLGIPASLKDQESVPPIALRLESETALNLLGENYLTRPFLSLVSAFYPLGNSFSLGIQQQMNFMNAGAGVSFDANGQNLKSLGPVFFSLSASKDFDSFSISGRYTLHPMADFDFNKKKEQKHLLALSLEFGGKDKEGPRVEILPASLTEKDQKIYLSPNSDGINDYYSFNLKMEDPSGLQEWLFQVMDRQGKIVYEKGVKVENEREKDFRFAAFGQIFQGRQEAFYPTEFLWPCVDSEGKTLPDGIYTARIMAKDFKGNLTRLGNSFSKEENQTLVLDTVPPSLKTEILYRNFSPNDDGIQDFLLIDHKNLSEEGLWSMEIRAGDSPVFRRNWSGKPDETVKWDGKNEDGAVLPDGNYEYVMKVTDRAGNETSYRVGEIVIDTRSPVVRAKNLENYFSPNGDKIKDNIEVEQEFNKEGLWTGEIINSSGEPVKTYQWKGLPPKTLVWDGKNERGEIESDGKYLYRVKGKDAAGNQTEQTLTHFIIDTKPPQAEVSVSDPYFSPNQDGKKDLLLFQVETATEEDLWLGEIRQENGKTVKTFTWKGIPPRQFTWDGLTHKGKPAPEGTYRFVLKSSDRAGNHMEQMVGGLVLDQTAPELKLAVEDKVFSPARDTGKISFEIKGSKEGEIRLIDGEGKPVFKQKISSDGGTFFWDGRDEQDQPVKDGPYRVMLSSEDAAGNFNQTQEEISVLTLIGKITLKSDRQVINPEKEANALIRFSATIPEFRFLNNLTLEIINENQEVVFEEHRTGLEEGTLKMDFRGITRTGMLPHGAYVKKITARYANGEIIESNPVSFQIDRRGPSLSLNFTPELFSPDEDGEDDFLNIQLQAKDSSGIARWRIVIVDRFKENFKSFAGKEEVPAVVVWDGKSSSGELTDSAEDYLMMAEAEDRVGNISRTPFLPFTTDILVIKTDRGYKIRISNIEFALNRATLKPNAVTILNKVAAKLEKYPQYRIRIEGHADRTGSENWNEKLSLMRAEAVKKYLSEEKHLEALRFTTEGMGSRIPLYPNDSEKNRAKNRRVEFLLVR